MDKIPNIQAERDPLVYRMAQALLDDIESGTSVEHCVEALKTSLRQHMDQTLCLRETDIVTIAATHAFYHGRRDIAEGMLAKIDPTQWTKGVRKLRRKLLPGDTASDETTQAYGKSGSPIIEIQRGNFVEAHRLAMSFPSTPGLEQVGKTLLEKGYPRLAADIAMKMIASDMTLTNEAGYKLGSLNLLARAARADSSLYETLLHGIEVAKAKGLPDEYAVRIIYLYETGRVYEQSKVRSKNRNTSGYLSNDTRSMLDTLRKTGGIEELPDLDGTGDLKREFLSLLEQQKLFEAGKLICTLPTNEIRKAYEIRIVAAINKACPFSELEKLAAIFHDRRKILTAVLRKAIASHPFNSAFALFMAYGSDDDRYSRSVGDGLVHIKNGERYLIEGAQALLDMEKPRTALELLKPKILVILVGSKRERLPVPILHIFAKAAKADSEILESLIEQLEEYRQRELISDPVINTLLLEAMAAEQQLQARQRIFSGKRTVESDDDFKGRITRSSFFADPHALLRARPINRTAAQVAGSRNGDEGNEDEEYLL